MGEKDTGPQESKQLCSRLLADGLLSFHSTLEHCLAPFLKSIITSTSSGLLICYGPPARTQGVSRTDRPNPSISSFPRDVGNAIVDKKKSAWSKSS